jgi:hypothetical protein
VIRCMAAATLMLVSEIRAGQSVQPDQAQAAR